MDMRWALTVEEICHQIGFDPHKAWVCGGKVVEMLTGTSAKDVDVFFLIENDDQYERIEQQLDKDPLYMRKESAYPAYLPEDQLHATCGRFWYTDNNLDLIFYKANSIREVIREFDLGICSMAYNCIEDNLQMTSFAASDLRDHLITCLYPAPLNDLNRFRLETYRKRLGWPLRKDYLS